MAAEASRSGGGGGGGGGAADSYVGSLISLTSKSEIRYEGVLFNINTEEASIGLRNVRSFGTEGRRKDGQQVPAIDKVYEYIVFRGSDIKDLQVKSSPPVQTAPPVHNDPAIIQSHYNAPTAPSSLPASVTTAAGSVSDFSNQLSQPGVPLTTYQNSVPIYPPGGNMASWTPSAPPTTNVGGISAPMYWQGYYGPTGSRPTYQQQPLLHPVQGLSMPPPPQPQQAQPQYPTMNSSQPAQPQYPTMNSSQPAQPQYPTMNSSQSAQQPAQPQYPTMNSSLPTGSPNISTPQSMEFPPALLQPIVSSTLSMHSSTHPVHSSAPSADSSTNMMPSKVPSQVVSQSTNSPLVPPVLSNTLDRGTAAPLIHQAKPVSTTSVPFNSFSDSRSSVGGKSTSSPVLVTPGQFLQPVPTVSQTAQTEQKDVEVVQVSAPQSSTILKTVPAAESQPPLLPLPSPSNSRMNGVPAQTHYTNRGGRGGRGGRRGNEFSHPVANFNEDFDFEAMNEKFKKDEVWGHLGKSKADAIDFEDGDDVEVPKADANPVYKKDDFFDSLSCNSMDRESRNGRTRFSEQMKLDTETFGNFPRNRGFRGGRGPGGGRSRGGGYYGRGNGYGYVGRGRGHNVYRAI